MLKKLKIAVGKFICDHMERHGLRVVLVDHDDNDTARLEWWAKHYMAPLSEASCQMTLDFGKDLAHTQDFRKSIDNMRLAGQIRARWKAAYSSTGS